ncbi:MAG: thiamine-phosphate kinase [Rhodovibrionaceae bacterium]|nr:thiamine-phosphate kinase [Rhodovibrionaceae bacterium]
MRGEFDLIARYFAPLAGDQAGSFGLQNDAAVFQPPAGRALVATLDTLVAGVHFLPEDPADLVARKLLRVNLSDLAAMGARPSGYLVALSLSRDAPDSWVEHFARGLKVDQQEFRCHLLGGDTTGTPGPTTLSLTLLGDVAPGRALGRGPARAGDAIFVSGTVGDAALGLKSLREGIQSLAEQHAAYLAERYRLPRPRIELGARLAVEGLATAAIDVSDGLAADLNHMCEVSALGAEVEAAAVPLSPAAKAALDENGELLEEIFSGGDDYELLFTVPPEAVEAVEALSRELDCPVTRIGRMRADAGVVLRDERGEPIALKRGGWTHF